MRESFNKAFAITIGLEGRPSNDPDDPGGFTIWGLAKRYHPWISKDTTIEEAKECYIKKYWIPQGCDNYPYPYDVILFDSAVNPQNDPKIPGAGNKELLSLSPENWQDYCMMRMVRYLHNSKAKFVDGHIARVLRLYEQVKEGLPWTGKK